MSAIVTPPPILEIVDVSQVPPRSEQNRGKGQGVATIKRGWKKLLLQVFDLPQGKAVKLLAPNQGAWVSGRITSRAKEMGGKVVVAIRREHMYVWWVDRPPQATITEEKR